MSVAQHPGHRLDPAAESGRVRALHDLDVLDSPPEAQFDELVELAASICGTPISLITLIDTDRQWIKARFGIEVTETPRSVAFCDHALICAGRLLLVEDATRDPRFADNPMVTEDPRIRFYAGAPLVTRGGHTLGTLCVVDLKPRVLRPEQLRALEVLARQAMRNMELRSLHRSARRASEILDREERLRTDYLQAISEASVELQVFIDRNYIHRYANLAYAEYWGQEAGAIVGKPVAEVVGEERFQSQFKQRIDRALAGETIRDRSRIDFPLKGARAVAWTVEPARDELGHVIGVIIAVHDIDDLERTRTELTHTVAALEQTIVAQKQFIHVVSHDLREPLNSILNFSSLVLADYSGRIDPQALEYVSYIAQGGRRMKRLILDLLSFLRLEQSHDARETLDLRELLREIEFDLDDLLENSGGRIEHHELCPIVAHRTQIRLLLQNLVSNALKFRRPGVAPKVTVSSTDHGGSWEIEVADNGIGIAQEHQGRIFVLFGRLHSTDKFEGTGLGLAICRKIAEMHAGSISVDSVEGQGSRFVVRIPKGAGQEAGQREARDAGRPLPGGPDAPGSAR